MSNMIKRNYNMTRKIFIGNWKMHGNLGRCRSLYSEISSKLPENSDFDVVVCPPFVYLLQLANLIGNGGVVKLGAQDASAHVEEGAFTGEVSTGMLKDLGCRYVIVGHSERRQYHNETDKLVAHKMLAVLSASMIPVVCVGESLRERESGQTRTVIERQLGVLIRQLEKLNSENFTIDEIIFAYEPIWAIGTGVTATPDQAQEVHEWIRDFACDSKTDALKRLRIVYGGSVNKGNAKAIMKQPDIDGCLVGGASLDSEEFSKICTES